MASNSFLVNSHYQIPWIVWKSTYSLSVPANTRRRTTLEHGLPFTPLLIGQWSDNPNFAPAYDLALSNTQRIQSSYYELFVFVEADSETVYFDVFNNTTSAKTVNFRLMAFAPPDYDGEVTPVEYSSKFRYNSHYRYQQLFKAGNSTTADVFHGLNYIPQAKMWVVLDGRAAPDATGTLTTDILHNDNMDYSDSFYYHIYKDKML